MKRSRSGSGEAEEAEGGEGGREGVRRRVGDVHPSRLALLTECPTGPPPLPAPEASRRAHRHTLKERRERQAREAREEAEVRSRASWGDAAPPAASSAPPAAAAPNFEVSGALHREENRTKDGIALKYSEPGTARKPEKKWMLYVFKGDEVIDTIGLAGRSSFLVGKDRRVCDLPADHPSCSKQHAVLQFKLRERNMPDGSTAATVEPYVIDLDSTNGTTLNGKRIEGSTYVHLLERDVLKFGLSTRDYVLLHEGSSSSGSNTGGSSLK